MNNETLAQQVPLPLPKRFSNFRILGTWMEENVGGHVGSRSHQVSFLACVGLGEQCNESIARDREVFIKSYNERKDKERLFRRREELDKKERSKIKTTPSKELV